MPRPTLEAYLSEQARPNTPETCSDCSGLGRTMSFPVPSNALLAHAHACPTCRPTARCWICRPARFPETFPNPQRAATGRQKENHHHA